MRYGHTCIYSVETKCYLRNDKNGDKKNGEPLGWNTAQVQMISIHPCTLLPLQNGFLIDPPQQYGPLKYLHTDNGKKFVNESIHKTML